MRLCLPSFPPSSQRNPVDLGELLRGCRDLGLTRLDWVRRRLQAADAAHPLLADLAAKSSLFDDAASRFAPSATA